MTARRLRLFVGLALGVPLSGGCKDASLAQPTNPQPRVAEPEGASPTRDPVPALTEIQQVYDEAKGDPVRLRPLEAQLDRFLAEHPDDPSALSLLAQVQLELGKLAQSLATAERCVEIAADTAACWLIIGVVIETMGPKDRAPEAYRRYLELAPEGRYAPDAHKALARLGAPIPIKTPGSTSATVSGFIDSTDLKTLLEARISVLKLCYDVALKARPELAGKITYTVSIDAQGRVFDVTIDEDTLGSSKVAACTKAKIKGWRLGAQEDSGQATFTVAFSSD